jgi:hypothetical protein
MRKISANHILPVSSPALINGIIRLDAGGRIQELSDTGGRLHEESGLEFHNGIIVPGFVIPWLRLEDVACSVRELDTALIRNGIKGAGIVLPENMATGNEFERMFSSSVIYHPIIELCPRPGECDFEVFNRGVERISLAWNEFNLSCSLTSCNSMPECSDLIKHLHEYNSLHRHVDLPEDPVVTIKSGVHPKDPDVKQQRSVPENPLNVLQWMQDSCPDENLTELLPALTIDAAASIFEDELLGSIEPGKQPGLNLITGYDPDTLTPAGNTMLRVLV